VVLSCHRPLDPVCLARETSRERLSEIGELQSVHGYHKSASVLRSSVFNWARHNEFDLLPFPQPTSKTTSISHKM
jgi:hypothetical protein